jgi:hypothetical protein
MPRFLAFNAAAPTTAAIVKVATGTAIKTHLQIATPSTRKLKVVEWGCSFDGSAAATPGMVELIQTDVAATSGTAHVQGGLQCLDDYNDPDSAMTLGTGATGYSFGTEGTITATRPLDSQLVAPTNQYVRQFFQDKQPEVGPSKFLRIRATFGTTVNGLFWIVWDE